MRTASIAGRHKVYINIMREGRERERDVCEERVERERIENISNPLKQNRKAYHYYSFTISC
jgi:hypothetical protein